MSGQLRVVLADDNPIVRAGLVALLGLDDEIVLCGQATSGDAALALVQEHRPHVLLLDVRMPGSDGLSVLADAVALTRVLMLTHSDEPEIVSTALRAGATGFLVHGSFDATELVTAIKDTAAGLARLSPSAAAVLLSRGAHDREPVGPLDPPAVTDLGRGTVDLRRLGLSRREVEICTELVQGATNAEIAARLYIEPKTVKNHLNRIFAKLGATSRGQAIAVCLGTVAPTTVTVASTDQGARR